VKVQVRHRIFGVGVARVGSNQTFDDKSELGELVHCTFYDARDIYGNVVEGAFRRDFLTEVEESQ
jgi:hypothetical protein